MFERRNAEHIICRSQKDDGQDELPGRENGGLSRKDGGHRFGDKFKRKKSVAVHKEVPKGENAVKLSKH
jgi:hypothetical protein